MLKSLHRKCDCHHRVWHKIHLNLGTLKTLKRFGFHFVILHSYLVIIFCELGSSFNFPRSRMKHDENLPKNYVNSQQNVCGHFGDGDFLVFQSHDQHFTKFCNSTGIPLWIKSQLTQNFVKSRLHVKTLKNQNFFNFEATANSKTWSDR